ncbi:MAG TPA: translation initiation factor IF-3 [Bacteroidales bacterium]|nr:translation initiation factor IF-3 [Bacteroidales bacterium]
MATPIFRRDTRREELPQFAVNYQIKAPVVRVVGENLENPGIFPIKEAIKMAEDLELDLVEISPSASPPVCKIIDYQKFLYQQRRKQKELKAKTAKIVVKEIRFGPYTDDHDYNFKMKHAQKFLQDGAKVKAYVFFKGRSIVYNEDGEALLQRFANDLAELGKMEQAPKLEGKRMIMLLTPLPRKIK